jgi:hypothetical protein
MWTMRCCTYTLRMVRLRCTRARRSRRTAAFYTDIATYLGLLTGQIGAETAVANHLIQIEGEPGSLQRFLNLCGLPAAAVL